MEEGTELIRAEGMGQTPSFALVWRATFDGGGKVGLVGSAEILAPRPIGVEEALDDHELIHRHHFEPDLEAQVDHRPPIRRLLRQLRPQSTDI